jgi:hypothetical protein
LYICIVGVLVNALPVVKDVKDADAKIVEDIYRTRPVTPMVNHIVSRTEQYSIKYPVLSQCLRERPYLN